MIKKKKLIIFMPSIEGGGVEKNLFIVSKYLSSKIAQLFCVFFGIDEHADKIKKVEIKIIFLK